MSDLAADITYVRIQDWVLLHGDVEPNWGRSGDYFMVWVSDNPPDDQTIKACGSLAQDPLAFPAFTIRIAEVPSFGLIVHSKTALGFEDSVRAQATLEKIIWEILRLSRS